MNQDIKYMDLQEYIKKIVEKSNLSKVYIYGAGLIAEELYYELKKWEVIVEGFIVSSKTANRYLIDDIQIKTLDEMEISSDIYVVIGTKQKFAKEIALRLEDAGIKKYELPIDNIVNLLGVGNERFERPNLEITTRIGCSINCKYCPQSILTRAYSKLSNAENVLSFEKFKLCIDKLPRDCIVTFSGFCEPFLNTDCINMIEYVASKNMDITLNSTLMGLTYEEAKKLAKLPIKHMIYHSPDIKGYAHIEVTEEYRKCLDYLLEQKGEDGRPFIKTANCQSVPTPEILELINGRVTFSSNNLQDIAGNIKDEAVFENIYIGGDIYCAQSEKMNRNVLLPNGDVVLCCLDYGLKHIVGNLLKDSYFDIINSKELSIIKEKMCSGEEVICRHCCLARKR